MPNLKPPVRNASDARAYRERILAHVPPGAEFEPLMTLYLTDQTTRQDIIDAKATGFVYACKLYPAGATTNSDSGVTNPKNIYHVFEQMQQCGMLLLIHGEVTTPTVNIFDREEVFIEEIMKPLVKDFPNLKIVMEHVTTSNAVDFINSCGDNVAATITAHHLRTNTNMIFAGGISPHLYCLPIIKDETHRRALVKAAISGSPKFFAGTDSAPHEVSTKECCRGHAGIYTAHAAVPLYVQTFADMNALDKVENFLSVYGAKFYGIPVNKERMILNRSPWNVARSYPYKGGTLIPFHAGDVLDFKCVRGSQLLQTKL